MKEIYYIDRETKEKKKEKIYGHFYLKLLYGDGRLSFLSSFLAFTAKVALFSKLYGWVQKTSWSRKKVLPFIREYGIDASEFLEPASTFSSFNTFFIRKLKPRARPFPSDPREAIVPADARYRVFPKVDDIQRITIKGRSFSLEALLRDKVLAKQYKRGNMVIARLCPVDYHRFHFPCDGVPSEARLINGALYSVNPLALCRNLSILTENKRMITEFDTKHFGKILYIEIGAMCVGSIKQTYKPGRLCQKGDEKGYFEFGGSCLLLLFEEGKISFSSDLMPKENIEVYSQWGKSMGKAR